MLFYPLPQSTRVPSTRAPVHCCNHGAYMYFSLANTCCNRCVSTRRNVYINTYEVYFHGICILRPTFYLFFLVVTRFWDHKVGLSPSSPTTVHALQFLSREGLSPLFPRRLASKCGYRYTSQVHIHIYLVYMKGENIENVYHI